MLFGEMSAAATAGGSSSPIDLHHKRTHANDCGGSLVRAFLLLPTDYPIIGVSWTLVYEMYFYCIFACALALKSRLASALASSATIMLLLAVSIRLAGTDAFLGNPIVLEFCFGMLLAYAFSQGWLPDVLLRYGWAVGSAMLVLASFYAAHDTTNGLSAATRWIAWRVPALFVVASSLQFRATGSAFRKLQILIGDASYAIYLTHPFVMIAYAKLLHDHPKLLQTSQLPFVPFVLMIAIVAGIFAHIFVERPLMDAARKRVISNKSARLARRQHEIF